MERGEFMKRVSISLPMEPSQVSSCWIRTSRRGVSFLAKSSTPTLCRSDLLQVATRHRSSSARRQTPLDRQVRYRTLRLVESEESAVLCWSNESREVSCRD